MLRNLNILIVLADFSISSSKCYNFRKLQCFCKALIYVLSMFTEKNIFVAALIQYFKVIAPFNSPIDKINKKWAVGKDLRLKYLLVGHQF